MQDFPFETERGFSLVELLVVVVILGILAAIAVPRYLEQRQSSYNTMAVSDLRNLAVTQTGLEATDGLSDDPGVIAGAGWAVSDPSVVVCAELSAGGDDITLTAWHSAGSVVYTWTRTVSRVVATPVPVPEDCAAATAGTTVS